MDQAVASNTTAQQIRAAIRNSPLLHFSTCVKIANKQRKLETPKPNVLQARFDQVYEAMQALSLPTMILALKPRQTGCSTKAAHTCYHHQRRYNSQGVMMADDFGNSKNLFRIFKRYAETDVFDWGFDYHAKMDEISFENGSFNEQDTGMNPKAGIANSRQVIWLSEVAKYPSDGIRDARETVSNMLASLNKKGPNSLAILETTAEGAFGVFYDLWQGGVTLQEFLDGNAGNGWIKVFAAWHEFEDHAEPVTADERDAIMNSLTAREKRGIERFNWTPEQLKWRRFTLDSVCQGDERIFDKHYPEDEVVAFQAAGTPRFNQDGMLALEKLAAAETITYGLLNAPQDDPTAVSLTATDKNEAWLQLHEEPRVGYRYLLIVDPSTGAANQRGKDPDRHSAKVFRMPCRDEDGKELPMRLAARIIPPCYLDTDVLATCVTKMHHFYGRCCTVVERNMGHSLIELLKLQNVNLYVEERIDAITSKPATYYGFNTDKESRTRAIDRLAALVRQTTVERPALITDAHSVAEYRTFMRTDAGRFEAMSGCHDDDVLADAIAAACMESATLLRDKPRTRKQPTDHDSWKRIQ